MSFYWNTKAGYDGAWHEAETIAQCIADARAYEPDAEFVYTQPVTAQTVAGWVDKGTAAELLDQIAVAVLDNLCPEEIDGWPDTTNEAEEALGRKLQAAVAQWEREFDITPFRVGSHPLEESHRLRPGADS